MGLYSSWILVNNGFIIQYGINVTNKSPNKLITMPIAVTTRKSIAICAIQASNTSATWFSGMTTAGGSLTQFEMVGSVTGYSLYFEWLAIGY